MERTNNLSIIFLTFIDIWTCKITEVDCIVNKKNHKTPIPLTCVIPFEHILLRFVVYKIYRKDINILLPKCYRWSASYCTIPFLHRHKLVVLESFFNAIDHLPVSDLILKLYFFDIVLFELFPLRRTKWFTKKCPYQSNEIQNIEYEYNFLKSYWYLLFYIT
jgi:hypothetical protein